MRPSITDNQYREKAREIHQEDGKCEIDDNAVVSVSDDAGAYVQAWVWVYDSDIIPDADVMDSEEEEATLS